MDLLFAVVLIILLAGIVGITVHLHIKDGRTPITGRLKKQVYQSSFALMLDTPSKKARHLKEHREWDQEFYGRIANNDPNQLIIYNGNLITIGEADRLYFIEE